MEYASPFVQLLGVAGSVLVCILCIIASSLLLKEKNAGPWIMLIGSVAALIGTAVPQSLYAIENFMAVSSGAFSDSYFTIRNVMYYSLWDWLSTGAWLLFASGLLLFVFTRRGQARRIAELETILATLRKE